MQAEGFPRHRYEAMLPFAEVEEADGQRTVCKGLGPHFRRLLFVVGLAHTITLASQFVLIYRQHFTIQ